MEKPLVTRSMMVQALKNLGVRPHGVLMFHTRMSALGHVVGGADAVVLALMDAVGSQGTLMAVTGWDDDAYEFDAWDQEHQRAYLSEMPVFDPAVSSSTPDNGRLPERLRTWPGALRSNHPESSVAALGVQAAFLTNPHPLDDGFGPGTPYARLVELDGQVLMLGAPLETITLLHHAEAIARAGPKIHVKYRAPMLQDGHTVWVEMTDIESSTGAFDYSELVPEGMDPFEFIARAALAAGVGVEGKVGEAVCRLFGARELVTFTVGWMERHFPLK